MDRPLDEIPLFDVKAANDPAVMAELVAKVAESGQYILGPSVGMFEADVASYLDVDQERCIGVASGTDALVLALRALDLQRHDEVITTAFSFVATAAAIVRAGGTPVFVDVGDDLNIDPAAVERAITRNTRAILPVHLYGRPAAMDRLAELGLPLIVDAAQAFGARYHGQPVGADDAAVFATCFSFFPTKPLGGIGDGGMVVARSAQAAQRIRQLRVQGCASKCDAEIVGYNSRLDSVQAAVLSRKLLQIDARRHQRIWLASRYSDGLSGLRLVTPRPDNGSAWAVYTVMTRERDRLKRALAEEGIASAVFYPKTFPQMAAFAAESVWWETPMADAASERVLSLPLYAELSVDQQDRIIEVVRRTLGG